MKSDLTRNPIGNRRFAVAFVLAVFCVTTALAVMPFVQSGSAAAATAMPAATPDPNEVLTEESAGALIDEYSGALMEILNNDQTTVNAIIGGWDAANLAGKTRGQAMTLLFIDVKPVVSDTAVQNQIMNRWKNGADSDAEPEPTVAPVQVPPVRSAPNGGGNKNAPAGGNNNNLPAGDDNNFMEAVMVGRRAPSFLSPEAGISSDLKLQEGVKESYQFEGIIGQLRLSAGMPLAYKGQKYTVYQDLDDPDRQTKLDGINQGIKILIDRGINLPPRLEFYIAHDQNGFPRTSPFCKDPNGQEAYLQLPDGKPWPKCMNIPMAQTWKRDRAWSPVARIVISSLRPPNEKSISAMGINGLSKIPVTTIHEVCHLLHERFAGEFFWTIPPTPPTNIDVTQYANKAKKEFVAEVCAGLVLGLNFEPRVMTEYQQYRGPETSRRSLGSIPLFPKLPKLK